MGRDGAADLRDEMSRWPSGPLAFISYQDRKAVAATLNEIYQIYNAKDLLDAHWPAAPALPHRPFADRALQPDDVPDGTARGLPTPPSASRVLLTRRGDETALPSGVAPSRPTMPIVVEMLALRAGPFTPMRNLGLPSWLFSDDGGPVQNALSDPHHV